MNYIIFDLEWNQTRGRELLLESGHFLTGEIIEIGAVRLDDKFNLTGSFKYLVKPVFYKKIHSRVLELTGLDEEALSHGVPFVIAYENFLKFCGDNFVTFTWGNADIPVLKENLEAHGIEKWEHKNYDLQIIYKNQIKGAKRSTALVAAAEYLQLKIPGKLHDALNDASLTTAVLKKLDGKKGIAEYKDEFYDPMDFDHLSFEEIRKIDKQTTLRYDPRIYYTPCPYCQTPIRSRAIYNISKHKKMCCITCPEHGEFYVHMRICPDKSDTVSVHKLIYEMNPDLREYYNGYARVSLERTAKNNLKNKRRKRNNRNKSQDKSAQKA